MFKRGFQLFKRKARSKEVTIVSGLPRSGTSMMMQILAAGGIDLVSDGVRQADESNRKGYYEHEQVKSLGKGNVDFLDNAQGKAVKVVSPLLKHLPSQFDYKVIFMVRSMDEILASQQAMMSDLNTQDQASDVDVKKHFEKHLQHVQAWVKSQPNMSVLVVNYQQVIEQPDPIIKQLRAFVSGLRDTKSMLSAIDKTMYHNQVK